MKNGLWWVQAGLALVLTLTIIGISVVGTLAFRPLYYEDIENLQISKVSGYSEAEIRENYDAIIDYNLRWQDGRLSLPSIPMSENGILHFEDVKDVFDMFKYIAVYGGLFSMAGILFMARKKEYRYLKMTAKMSFFFPALLGLVAVLFWKPVFLMFHELFFDNNYWVFNPEMDPVIRILPSEFFLHCAILIFGGVLLGATVCGGCYLVLHGREQKNQDET